MYKTDKPGLKRPFYSLSPAMPDPQHVKESQAELRL